MKVIRELSAVLGFVAASALATAARPAVRCASPGSPMERSICSDPALAARDDALNRLYRGALQAGPVDVQRAAQRRWLAQAQACLTATCLTEAYDRRAGELLQQDDGRRLARRFHMHLGAADGDLLMFAHGGWITYDIVQTVVGPRGVAAGDVSAARLSGTVRLTGPVAIERKGAACQVIMRSRPDGAWSVRTRSCFSGDRADLDGLYLGVTGVSRETSPGAARP